MLWKACGGAGTPTEVKAVRGNDRREPNMAWERQDKRQAVYQGHKLELPTRYRRGSRKKVGGRD